MVTILFTGAAEISLGHFPYPTEWTPVSDWVAGLFDPLSERAREAADTVFLWWHSLIILGFLVYLTSPKPPHTTGAGINVLSPRGPPKGALKPMEIDLETM